MSKRLSRRHLTVGRVESTRCHGEWRSLVAHPAGGRAVAGSNPVSPTSKGPANPPLSEIGRGGAARLSEPRSNSEPPCRPTAYGNCSSSDWLGDLRHDPLARRRARRPAPPGPRQRAHPRLHAAAVETCIPGDGHGRGSRTSPMPRPRPLVAFAGSASWRPCPWLLIRRTPHDERL
jgi:hypothetical protein